MSNVAVCISGQPRNVEYCYPFIRDMILEPNDNPDVFVHCWFDDWMAGKSMAPEWQPLVHAYNTKHNVGWVPELEKSKPIREDALDMIKALYRPKGYVFENSITTCPWHPENEAQQKTLDHTTGFLSCISQMKSRYLSNEIKRLYEQKKMNGYYAVIFIRFDLMPVCKIEAKTFDTNKIITPDSRFDKRFGVADEWGLSSSSNMDVYAQCFLAAQDICSLPIYREDTGLCYGWAIEYLCNVVYQIPLQIVTKNFYIFRDHFKWKFHGQDYGWRLEAMDIKPNRREIEDLSPFMPDALAKKKDELIDPSWYDQIVFEN